MIQGHATKEGTLRFSQKNHNANPENFRVFYDLTLSNVGIGTYLGQPDEQTDELVKNAIKTTVLAGINVIDTAINYRSQQAERSVGKAVVELVEQGKLSRDEIFVSTKNGYVTGDGKIKEDFWQYVNREYVEPGIIKANDISSGYHCMTVPYLEDQLNRSLKNLELDCVDLIYLHNAVEGQIQDMAKEEFMKKLKTVFEFYETQRKEGKIQFYGMATWECFRVEPNNPQFLQLVEVLELAKQAGGAEHGFRFIQLPYNMYLDQAYMLKNQKSIEEPDSVSILHAAQENKIGVFSSVPLMQGRLLAPGVIPEFVDLKPSLRALQFIRSTPGILAPLVGHKTESHVIENLEIVKNPPLNEDEFKNTVKKLTKRQ